MVESIKKLREICQAPVINKNTVYARKFVRTFSIYFTKLFLYTNISANNVTLLMLIVGIIASIFLSVGSYFYSLIGVLLLQFWYILDNVDGEIARYRKKSSVKGVFMDLLNHHIAHPFIFIGISIGLFRSLGDYRFLLIGTSTAFFLLLQDLINFDKKEAKEIKMNKSFKKESKNNLESKQSLFKKITQILYKFPGIMNVFTIAAIFNLLSLAFLFYGITFPILVFLKVWHNLRLQESEF